jgi:K+-sensing histidine kinase KdpD
VKEVNTTNLLMLFPQLQFLEEMSERIFKNRKIEINILDDKIEKQLEFILNTVVCTGQFYHLVTIHTVLQKTNDSKMSGKCLMAYLSHELRNPLQSITLANHLIKTGIKSFEEKTDLKFPPKLTSHIDTVNKSCHDMKVIINDILDLSRIESNELIIEMEICNIDEITNGIIDENLYYATQKGLKLTKIIGNGTPKTIFTDMTRINQILNNLVSNAIKYSEKGNITLNFLRQRKKCCAI